MKIEITKEQKDRIAEIINISNFIGVSNRVSNLFYSKKCSCEKVFLKELEKSNLFNEFFEIGDAITRGMAKTLVPDFNSYVPEGFVNASIPEKYETRDHDYVKQIEIKCKSCGLVMLYDVDILGIRDILEGKE